MQNAVVAAAAAKQSGGGGSGGHGGRRHAGSHTRGGSGSGSGSASYLAGKSLAEIGALVDTIASPDLRARLLQHLGSGGPSGTGEARPATRRSVPKPEGGHQPRPPAKAPRAPPAVQLPHDHQQRPRTQRPTRQEPLIEELVDDDDDDDDKYVGGDGGDNDDGESDDGSATHNVDPSQSLIDAGSGGGGGGGTGSGGVGRRGVLRETPLLSAAEIRSILPAVVPGHARHYVRELGNNARAAAEQQKVLKEMANFSIRTERARAEADAERARLHRVAQQQGAALVASAQRMATMRASYEDQRLALERETQRAQKLERALRAMARQQQQQQQQQPAPRARLPQPSLAEAESAASVDVAQGVPEDATHGADCVDII